MPEDWTSLIVVLVWLATGGGSGALTYFIMDRVEWFKNLGPDHKRWVSWAMAVGFSWAAWGVMLLMGYEGIPASWQAIVEQLFKLGAVAILSTLGLHGAIDLRAKRKRQEV